MRRHRPGTHTCLTRWRALPLHTGIALAALLALLLGTTPALADSHADSHADDESEPQFRLELATGFGVAMRQIEGGGIDETVSENGEWSVSAEVLHRGWYGLQPGLFVIYDRTLDSGDAPAEVNLGLMLRYSFLEHFWVQGGYMFFMRRWDDSRGDLPNLRGQAFGPFAGGYKVAWMIGAGAQYPILDDKLYLVGKVTGRIRYFESRNGSALADGKEYGGLSIAPYVGVAVPF